ncbi:hypothetical protein A2477_04630 [Candidatus Falkowbacteria bacterium RIFOXYC2_FULL_47_12]|uniref:Radical SAM core domain-containing protein n=2 Tax=Candidatus Falkowiibacteriota TaxID=1752728 RepID=A0A1F5TLH3_9BACT|nr:MAG: hypothetical protein A2242_02305 [Candidatus Falkowbacteria bacterium RIFOXYA2_FULL_47_9]OGF39815.1 MAG: hypothetical protein A2477_04630 [Candidatus Falkowbacteria bacterium RIFOXYC2_FULL_47_12]
MPLTRFETFQTLFPAEPAWRFRQIERALFDPRVNGWQDISNLPQDMRAALAENVAWSSIAEANVYASKDGSTRKALVQLHDREKIETVLMKNKRGEWSVCVSSQVGCSMNCSFCATGRMGLRRNLTADEIIDQLRFWYYFLRDKKLDGRISNIVMMGMGEPLANYENVKSTLRQWLACTDIGPNHITVSTVGLLPFLQKILQDAAWPPVRIAISLHSADETLRKKIVPTTTGNYLAELSQWIKKYLQTKASNKRHVTFEYVLLRGVNDSVRDAKLLADFVTTTGRVKVNLIPFNDINDAALQRSNNTDEFAAVLKKCGVTVTVRQSAGLDIMAACGQLANSLYPRP